MNLKNKKGFTLLEIIIVIIIIGVLASLALPRFFSTVEYSRSTEAMNAIGILRKSVERCSLFQNDYTDCGTLLNLDVGDPGGETGAHFSYAVTISNAAEPTKDYTITATRLSTIDGGDENSIISFQTTTTGIIRSGATAFAAIK